MSLNGILASSLSALQTSQQALSTVSSNVANINTAGYARRVVNLEAQVSGNQLSGVSVADIQRVTDQFLTQETLSAQASSSQASAVNDAYTQLNGLLGQPGDSSSLTTQLDNVFTALSSAALAPTSGTSQQGALTAFQNMASTISNLSSTIGGLQNQADQQIVTAVPTVNSLVKQIYTMNSQIQTATAAGNDSTGLLDQRDQAVQQLSQLISVRTATGANGQMIVSTQDGVQLVGDTYAQLSYAGGSSTGTYPSIQLSNINPATGQAVGSATTLDPHLGSGQIAGLISMRDGALAQFQQELGNFAQETANAFNAQHNANAAYPPPTSLTGRDTGLASTDSLGFTGKTTIAVTDPSGKLVSRIDVNFGAGTLSVDGGAATSIGTTVGSFVTALNSALGSNGSASFANGQLSISATGTNGIVTQDDATTPASRGGAGFSQFFGLNNLFTSAVPTITATGLSSSDAGNFAAGGTMSFALKDASGNVVKTASVALTGSETIGGVISALNTAFGGAETFSLGSDGSLGMTPSAAYANDSFAVTADSTVRGTTGLSFTQLFGLGPAATAAIASGFSVNSAISSAPQRLAFGQPSITGATVAGDQIVSSGDASGLQALQNLSSTKQTFAAAGGMVAQSSTLSSYAANFYQDVATRGAAAKSAATAQSDRLTAAQQAQSSVSGVNLDEELTNMMTYQQAYSAGARMLQVVQTLYNALLQIQ
ncbi:MAG: flagellar hook-associated protein FlgK [Alphaproteobacteria bacterium]|nr:flagellar hook-associated protein FlgK [Alphaproteobacteria bacterium]MDE2073329.1 flagellar hook-associated protein FlgK [Alphaproteobacteria bacterium]